MNKRLVYLVLALFGGVILILLGAPRLAKNAKFGLEFRGGYEIQYAAESLNPGERIERKQLVECAQSLRKRADSIGMAEPEIAIEGKDKIRVKIAGAASVDQVRSVLGDSKGLPLRLTERYTQTVGSVLGAGALKDTLIAGAVGLALICMLLITLYRGFGVLASFCLLVYLWLLAELFNVLHATISLSAIVAFVLGVGMAADASVIWFERIREELRSCGVLAASARLSFRSALRTVLDANAATAIAMLVLFLVGIGPIQGFSLTMLFSMFLSVASSLLLLRGLCWLAAASSLPQWVLFPTPKTALRFEQRHFDFVKWGRLLAGLSVAVMVWGVCAYERHGLNLDIDFTAGTALDMDLPRQVSQEQATQLMEKAGMVPDVVAIGGGSNSHVAARFGEILKPEELNAIVAVFKAEFVPKVEYEENTADPGASREFALKALCATLAASVGIVLFLGLRFSWSMAAGSFIAIAHDMLIVSALFAIFKCEVDVTYIAAMLTVMGYSLNDKIVIFSRVKENLVAKGAAAETPLQRIVNESVWQTLGRSIYTVLAVVVASISLLFLACEPLQLFSLAILLGLLSGCYSSLFLSTALWTFFKNFRNRAVDATTVQIFSKSN